MCLSCSCQLGRRCRAQQYVSRGCLIIVPDPLVSQWYDEIRKHFRKDTFTVFVYESKEKRRNVFHQVDPIILASHDIVIATHAALTQAAFYTLNKFPMGTLRVAEHDVEMDTKYFPGLLSLAIFLSIFT